MAERAARAALSGGARAALVAVLCVLAPGAVRAGEATPEGAPQHAVDASATGPGRGAPAARLAPEQVLADFDPSAPLAPDTARDALRRLPQARAEAGDGLLRERIDCYRRFFVNRCLADVRSRELQVSKRLEAIEVGARQSLREEAAYERAEREAQRLEGDARTAQAEADRRRANREAFEAREAAAAEALARREREAPDLERREAANRAAREQREAAAAGRRTEAARRAAQAPSNVAEREREIEDAERRRAQGDSREAVRRERRRQEAERRRDEAEAQRRRAEQRESEAAAVRAPARVETPASVPGDAGAPAAR